MKKDKKGADMRVSFNTYRPIQNTNTYKNNITFKSNNITLGSDEEEDQFLFKNNDKDSDYAENYNFMDSGMSRERYDQLEEYDDMLAEIEKQRTYDNFSTPPVSGIMGDDIYFYGPTNWKEVGRGFKELAIGLYHEFYPPVEKPIPSYKTPEQLTECHQRWRDRAAGKTSAYPQKENNDAD